MQPEDLIPCPDCGADLCPSELTDDWECGDGGCLWTTANYGPCPRPTFAWWAKHDHAAAALLTEAARLRADLTRMAAAETDARIRLGDAYREIDRDRHPRSPVAWLLRRLARRWERR